MRYPLAGMIVLGLLACHGVTEPTQQRLSESDAPPMLEFSRIETGGPTIYKFPDFVGYGQDSPCGWLGWKFDEFWTVQYFSDYVLIHVQGKATVRHSASGATLTQQRVVNHRQGTPPGGSFYAGSLQRYSIPTEPGTLWHFAGRAEYVIDLSTDPPSIVTVSVGTGDGWTTLEDICRMLGQPTVAESR